MTETRTFESGATRNSAMDKFDYEGFLSPVALERYAKYMHDHRHLEDGSIRDSDNWQKGIPKSSLMKSLLRHVVSAWKWHRGIPDPEPLEDALCGILFNTFGYLHELHRDQGLDVPNSSNYVMDVNRKSLPIEIW